MPAKKKVQVNNSFEPYNIHPDEPVFTSGVVSRLLSIPVWVLKQLDIEGVVSPPREENCSRLYSNRELKQLAKIWYYMREKQVKVPAIKVILEMERRIEKLEG